MTTASTAADTSRPRANAQRTAFALGGLMLLAASLVCGALTVITVKSSPQVLAYGKTGSPVSVPAPGGAHGSQSPTSPQRRLQNVGVYVLTGSAGTPVAITDPCTLPTGRSTVVQTGHHIDVQGQRYVQVATVHAPAATQVVCHPSGVPAGTRLLLATNPLYLPGGPAIPTFLTVVFAVVGAAGLLGSRLRA